MKKIIYLLVAGLSFLTISCNADFEEVNTSPNDSPVTDPNLLLSTSITATQNIMYSTFVGGDMGLCWAQQWSKVQYNDEEKYIPRRSVMNQLWQFLYAGDNTTSKGAIAEAKSAFDLAGTAGNSNLQGAALVMQANAFQILTDVYGPVPFTEAVVKGNSKPVFDSQEVVYNGILAMLDQADALFASGTGTITPTADLIYHGDAMKWRKFAKALKLKALMRISKVRNVSAEVNALVSSGMLMGSNADSAQLAYVAAQPDANPIYETIVFGSRTEYKVSSVLVNKLNTLSDPRLPVYAQLNNASAYVGNVPGVENPSSYAAFSSPGTFYLEPTLPGVFMSYAQQELLLAEAANEGIIGGGLTTAKTYYESGITANMAFNGVIPGSYLSSVAFTTQVDAREKIATQEWLALYGQGIEAWTEWRRTGFPVLAPAFDAAITSIPKRFYYSTDSQNYNQTNYTAASATLDQGDTMLSKLWWMN